MGLMVAPFKKHRIFSGQISADCSSTETLYCLRWFDTVFSAPYLTFSFGRVAKFLDSDRGEIYTSYRTSIEILCGMLFGEIDISIATINEKRQNQETVNLTDIRFKAKKLIL